MEIGEFQRLLRQQGEELYRDMPWRQDTRPYYVLVSELMLQQTQVDRVVPKFEAFVRRFPDEEQLAGASLSDVLTYWQGLGYNRRARFLHEAVKMIINLGAFPSGEKDLLTLPGVGKNTAGAIRAYAFNKPAVFIETNIRAVYIHHFFADSDTVDDQQITPLLEQTIDTENPRHFYWALMDYGTWLKRQGIKPSRSRHYKKQAPLKGSVREVRGRIIKTLTSTGHSRESLYEAVGGDDRFERAVSGLVRDRLIAYDGSLYHLTK
jgi:A/G-specific adenine glycosylase